jgi:hypothetical protein
MNDHIKEALVIVTKQLNKLLEKNIANYEKSDEHYQIEKALWLLGARE